MVQHHLQVVQQPTGRVDHQDVLRGQRQQRVREVETRGRGDPGPPPQPGEPQGEVAGHQFGRAHAEGHHLARPGEQVDRLPEGGRVEPVAGLLQPVHGLVEDLVDHRPGVPVDRAAAHRGRPAAVHEVPAELPLEVGQPAVAERLGGAYDGGVAGAGGAGQLFGGGERHVLDVVAQILRDPPLGRGERGQLFGDPGVETGGTGLAGG